MVSGEQSWNGFPLLIRLHSFSENPDNSSTHIFDEDDSMTKWWRSYAECPLLNIETETNKIRLVTELIQLTGAFLYILAALREAKFLGYKMFIENLVSESARFILKP